MNRLIFVQFFCRHFFFSIFISLLLLFIDWLMTETCLTPSSQGLIQLLSYFSNVSIVWVKNIDRAAAVTAP